MPLNFDKLFLLGLLLKEVNVACICDGEPKAPVLFMEFWPEKFKFLGRNAFAV